MADYVKDCISYYKRRISSLSSGKLAWLVPASLIDALDATERLWSLPHFVPAFVDTVCLPCWVWIIRLASVMMPGVP